MSIFTFNKVVTANTGVFWFTSSCLEVSQPPVPSSCWKTFYPFAIVNKYFRYSEKTRLFCSLFVLFLQPKTTQVDGIYSYRSSYVSLFTSDGRIINNWPTSVLPEVFSQLSRDWNPVIWKLQCTMSERWNVQCLKGKLLVIATSIVPLV